MKHSRYARSGAVAVLILLAACTHTYTPRPVAIERGRVPPFTVPEAIAVTNAHESATVQELGRTRGHVFHADLQKWTDTAVRVLVSELTSRGMPLSVRGERTIELSVTDAKLHFGFATWRCIIQLDATTDGRTRHYEGNAGSGVSYDKACDVSVARAVAQVLSDAEVLDFITHPATTAAYWP